LKIEKKGVGEGSPEGPKAEPFPWIDVAFGSATQIYTTPITYDEYGRPPAWVRRRQIEDYRAACRAT
jgi:hypothetical protein